MAARPLDPFVDVLVEVGLWLCAAASGAHSYDKIRLMSDTIAHASQAKGGANSKGGNFHEDDGIFATSWIHLWPSPEQSR